MRKISPNPRSIAMTGVTLVAAVVLASPLRANLADALRGSPPPTVGAALPTGADNRAASFVAKEVPKVTTAQFTKANDIALASPEVRRLVKGDAVRVSKEGPWSNGGVPNHVVGVVIWLELAHPSTIKGVWSRAEYGPADKAGPVPGARGSWTADQVELLYVQVDLVTDDVEGVMPLEPLVPGERKDVARWEKRHRAR
jgi:hypothetical protein